MSVLQEWYESVPRSLVSAAPGVAFRRSATLGSRIVRAQLPPHEIEVVLSDSSGDIEVVLSDTDDEL